MKIESFSCCFLSELKVQNKFLQNNISFYYFFTLKPTFCALDFRNVNVSILAFRRLFGLWQVAGLALVIDFISFGGPLIEGRVCDVLNRERHRGVLNHRNRQANCVKIKC